MRYRECLTLREFCGLADPPRLILMVPLSGDEADTLAYLTRRASEEVGREVPAQCVVRAIITEVGWLAAETEVYGPTEEGGGP